MNVKPSKWFLAKRLSKLIEEEPNLRLLDVGCGQSRNFLPLLQRHPQLRYVGVEPNPSEASIAADLLKEFPNAQVHNRLAYVVNAELGEFDVVVSLSVLEHVKWLRPFLEYCSQMARKGGRVIHLYDLGHSLYPTSLKERVKAFLSDSIFRRFLPESKIAGYVSEKHVRDILSETGVRIEEMTYHNMPSLNSLVKQIPNESEGAAILEKINELELTVARYTGMMPTATRERYFPSVCFWGVKQ